jgi:hypothetical protein
MGTAAGTLIRKRIRQLPVANNGSRCALQWKTKRAGDGFYHRSIRLFLFVFIKTNDMKCLNPFKPDPATAFDNLKRSIQVILRSLSKRKQQRQQAPMDQGALSGALYTRARHRGA